LKVNERVCLLYLLCDAAIAISDLTKEQCCWMEWQDISCKVLRLIQ